MLPTEIREELAAIANDRLSGATALVLRGIALFRRAAHDSELLRETARAVCRSQPAMAGFSTASALTLAADDPRRELDRLEARIRRSPPVIARIAASFIQLRRPTRGPLRIVTCSRSATTERTLLALHQLGPVRVCCSESRPHREGVALAQSLRGVGIEVLLYSDAGISAAVSHADTLLVGADAVSGGSFINKVGTAALAALAHYSGVPVLVLAGREKVLPDPAYRRALIVDGPSQEIDSDLPASSVRNPYFEAVPIELMSHLITDSAVVTPAEVPSLSLWSRSALPKYMSLIEANNMLDKN